MLKNIKLYGASSPLGPDYYLYISACTEAFKALEKNLSKKGTMNDYKYYPLFYLFFHVVELTLKNFYSIYKSFTNLNKSSPKNHKLKELWDVHVKLNIEKFKSIITQEDLNNIENIIYKFEEVNNYSVVFKYPDFEIHPSEKTDITDIIRHTTVDYFNYLNYKFEAIEQLLGTMKYLGFSSDHIDVFEGFAFYPSTLINKQIIKEHFSEKFIEALLILKQHYCYKLGRDCKFKTRCLSIEAIQEIRKISSQRARRYRQLTKKGKAHNCRKHLTIVEMDLIENDIELNRIETMLHDVLLSLTLQELDDLEALMGLGRGDITLVHYIQPSSHPRKMTITSQDRLRNVEYLIEKPLHEYLKTSLSIL